MNTLRKLRNFEINSPVIRNWMSENLYREGQVYVIPFGPLRGMKLIYTEEVDVHTMLGLWEFKNLLKLRKIIDALLNNKGKITVCDVGANLGLYSLWFSKVLKQVGEIYAFEPIPDIAIKLKKNIDINDLTNIHVVESACGDKDGVMEFYLGSHFQRSSFDAEWAGDATQKLMINVRSLDSFFSNPEMTPPSFIKMDIEGGATRALPGCRLLTEKYRPIYLIESHHPSEDEAIGAFMREHRYQGYRVTNEQWISDLKTVYPDPNGVWGTIITYPHEINEWISKVLQ